MYDSLQTIPPSEFFEGTWCGIVSEVESNNYSSIPISRNLELTFTFTRVTDNIVEGNAVFLDIKVPLSDPKRVYTEKILIQLPGNPNGKRILTADGSGNGINFWTLDELNETLNYQYNVAGNLELGALVGSAVLYKIKNS